MLEVVIKNQKLIMIQFVVFAVLFGSVMVISSIIYSKTTLYDLEKKHEKKNLAKSLEKSFTIGQDKAK